MNYELCGQLLSLWRGGLYLHEYLLHLLALTSYVYGHSLLWRMDNLAW